MRESASAGPKRAGSIPAPDNSASPPASAPSGPDGSRNPAPLYNPDLPRHEARDAPRSDLGHGLPSASELEQTLQRLVRRVAMMLRAEKCVFMLHDRERQELVARPPAVGLTMEQVRSLKLSAERGVSGTAFTTGQPVLVPEVSADLDAADRSWMGRLEVANLIAYPLVKERRDENRRVADRVTVGVLHVINKRAGEKFSGNDLNLLASLAGQVTALIADAQIYLRLTEQKEQLQATLQSLLAGVVMVESTGHISLLNPVARQIFGLQDQDVIGQPYDKVLRHAPVIDMLRAAVEHSEEMASEIEITLVEGDSEPRIFQAQTAFVRGERDGVSMMLGVVAIFNDITEIRNVERMKTAFVSTVSHELRTPLTSIKGFIATLLQDTEGYYDQETRTEFYHIIDSECDRLRRLIEDLLNVSRIESGRALQMNWSRFNPLPVIEKVLQALRSFTDKHKLQLHVHGAIPKILADADKLDQVVTNLVSNAIKYSPQGGIVRVEVSSDEMLLTVSVSDQGIGIPPDRLGRVFEKFERVDNRDTRTAGGTGLGLFLVKHLVERHEGRVWVTSEVNKGSTFTFEIPVTPSSAEAEVEALDRDAEESQHPAQNPATGPAKR